MLIVLLWQRMFPQKTEQPMYAQAESDIDIENYYFDNEFNDMQEQYLINEREGNNSINTKPLLMQLDRYKIQKDIIEVYPSMANTEIYPTQQEIIEGKEDIIQIVRDKEKSGLKYVTSIAGHRIEMMPTHVSWLIDLYLMDDLTPINNHIVVNKKIDPIKLPFKHLKKQGECKILTLTLDRSQCSILLAYVSKIINVPVMLPKPHVRTVAIIISAMPDHECIWSGSHVEFQGMSFLITHKITYSVPPSYKFIAVSVCHFPYTIEVKENEHQEK